MVIIEVVVVVVVVEVVVVVVVQAGAARCRQSERRNQGTKERRHERTNECILFPLHSFIEVQAGAGKLRQV